MDINNKILLNSVKLPNNVNVNTQIQFGLNNTNKPIPLTISIQLLVNLNSLRKRGKIVQFIVFMV